MKVKRLKNQYPIEDKVQKLLLGDATQESEIVMGLDEVLKRLDDDWEVVDELENDKFLMKKSARDPFANQISS